MQQKLKTLYKRNAKGGIQEWTIVADGDGYFTIEGIHGGKLTTSAPHTCEGKNAGRSNETTAVQQALKEATAEWKRKLERGYAESKDAIDAVTFKKPMKGDKWVDREKEVVWPVWVQDKLNGIRCQNDRTAAWSTGGKIFHTIPHIRQVLQGIYKEYPNAFIDGEAFNYNLRQNLNRLVSIVSVVIQPKDLTPELLEESKQIVQLHVFDGFGFKGITPETPYLERHAAVTELIKDVGSSYLQPTAIEKVDDIETLIARLVANKKKGGEGLMIRWGKCEYKNGRSKYMLKLKHFDDAEFVILDIQEGNADWAGAAKRIVLALPKPCKNREGVVQTDFAANIDGDRTWLTGLFRDRKKVIGSQATVEYQCLSEYGIPQIPWVRAIRNYE